MSEIPEDVTKRAEATVREIETSYLATWLVIAHALMEERERCAKIAETHIDLRWRTKECCQHIASLIRGTDAPSG